MTSMLPRQNQTDVPPAPTREDVYAAALVMREQLQLDRENSSYWQDRQRRLGSLDTVEGWLESVIDWAYTGKGRSPHTEYPDPTPRHCCAYCAAPAKDMHINLVSTVDEPEFWNGNATGFVRTVPIDYDYTVKPCGHVFRHSIAGSSGFTIMNPERPTEKATTDYASKALTELAPLHTWDGTDHHAVMILADILREWSPSSYCWNPEPHPPHKWSGGFTADRCPGVSK